MFPPPAMTAWSMSRSPTGRARRRTFATNSSPSPSARSGSGPRRAWTAAFSSGVMTSQAVGPVRSATPCSPSSRTRTAPRGSGGSHGADDDGAAGAPSSSCPASGGRAVSSSATRRRGAPMACGAWKEGSPAKVHDPYSPRCTRSQRSSCGAVAPSAEKPRNRCLPCASVATSRCPSSSAAPEAKRPWGELTASSWPCSSSSKASARRWIECPSGIGLLQGVPQGAGQVDGAAGPQRGALVAVVGDGAGGEVLEQRPVGTDDPPPRHGPTLARHHGTHLPCRAPAGAGAGGLGEQAVGGGAAGRHVVGEVEDELAPVTHAGHCRKTARGSVRRAVMLCAVTSSPTRTAHPSVVPLAPGYRLTELDDAEDRDAMQDVDGWAFAYEFAPEDEQVAVWTLEPGRSVGVWHDGPRGTSLAAMHSSFAFRVQVPGGEALPAAGLTRVGVHPGHRRRGLGRAMLLAHLRRSRERGEVFSVLNAAESGIYGRYGYGIATHRATATLGRGAGLRHVPGSEELVVELDTLDAERHSVDVEHVHGRVERPGWITRDTEALRRVHLLDWPSARRGAERRRIAVVRGADGEPRGYAVFRRSEKWGDGGQPQGTVRVQDALALDAAAARALWGALLDLDLMTTVEVRNLAPDDAVLGLLTDLRGINLRVLDDVWLRILDVPAALSTRAYLGAVEDRKSVV